MNALTRSPVSPKMVKVGAAVIIGVSLGTVLGGETVLVPGIGAVPGVVGGGVGALAGAALYRWGPPVVGGGTCDCTGDCGCS